MTDKKFYLAIKPDAPPIWLCPRCMYPTLDPDHVETCPGPYDWGEAAVPPPAGNTGTTNGEREGREG